jgi:hypothetical protein
MQIIFILAIILAPASAFAYLDPGSGAVLINLLIAGIAALIYALKGLFFRLIGKDQVPKPQAVMVELALFSEGSAYLHTFQPLAEALIIAEIHFAYYSLEIEDPLLRLDNPFCHNRFLGNGAMGRFRANNIPEPIVLSTTPNISCPGYPIKRSPKTQTLIHVFHSMVDIAMYRKGSLDHYDTVILPGEKHIPSVREIERKRGLKPKQLLSLGTPYLDSLLQEKQSTRQIAQENCILVASSWGDKGLLKQYGIAPFIALAEHGYQVILRPHPHSLKHEPEFIKDLQKHSAALPGIEWDTQLSPVESMSKAKLLISDTSSVRFDFAFIYEKPVLTLEIPVSAMPGFERDDLGAIWSDQAVYEIGTVLCKSEVQDGLEAAVKQTLRDFDSARIKAFRQTMVANFGCAAERIVESLREVQLQSTASVSSGDLG